MIVGVYPRIACLRSRTSFQPMRLRCEWFIDLYDPGGPSGPLNLVKLARDLTRPKPQMVAEEGNFLYFREIQVGEIF